MSKQYKFTIKGQEVTVTVDDNGGIPLFCFGLEGVDDEFLRKSTKGSKFNTISVNGPLFGNRLFKGPAFELDQFKTLDDFLEFYHEVMVQLAQQDSRYKKPIIYAPSAMGITLWLLANKYPNDVSFVVNFGSPLGDPKRLELEALTNFFWQYDPEGMLSELDRQLLDKTMPLTCPAGMVEKEIVELRSRLQALKKTHEEKHGKGSYFKGFKEGYSQLPGVLRAAAMRTGILALPIDSNMRTKIAATKAGRQMVYDEGFLANLFKDKIGPWLILNFPLFARYFEVIRNLSTALQNQGIDGTTSLDTIRSLSQKGVPVLVCHGVGDGQVPLPTEEQTKVLASLPGVDYHYFDSLHVPLDIANELLQVILDEYEKMVVKRQTPTEVKDADRILGVVGTGPVQRVEGKTPSFVAAPAPSVKGKEKVVEPIQDVVTQEKKKVGPSLKFLDVKTPGQLTMLREEVVDESLMVVEDGRSKDVIGGCGCGLFGCIYNFFHKPNSKTKPAPVLEKGTGELFASVQASVLR